MQTGPKIKILVTYKNKEPLIQSDIITPIQSGRAIATKIFEEMIGDDTGDNISSRNPIYSELSAIYWAWKNYDKIGNPEYIGFMHYRRQFIFNEKLGIPFPHWISSYYYFPSLHEAKAYFADNDIENLVPHFDYMIPKYHVTPALNIREEYITCIPGSKAYIFDTFIKICREIHPDWEEEIQKIENGNVVSVCNMFIMTKKLFFDYCDFVFPVLFELEKRIDISSLSTNGLRFCGYMAEKLQTMFTFRLEKKRTLKEKFLDCTYIRRDILRNDIKSKTATLQVKETKLLYVSSQMNYFRMKKLWYKLKKTFSIGKKRAKYQDKYKAVKSLLKEAKKFKKQLLKI